MLTAQLQASRIAPVVSQSTNQVEELKEEEKKETPLKASG